MRPFVLYSVLLLGLFSSLKAQVENRVEQPTTDIPDFYLDAISFQSPDSMQTRIDVYVQVSYDVLRFVSADSEFIARYEMTIDILGADGNEVLEKVWNEEVHTKTFEATQSKKGYSLSQRSITVAPGSYVMRAQMRESESRKVSVQLKKIIVSNYWRPVLSISDIMLINRVTQEAGRTHVVPNVSGNLYNVPDGFFLFFELYNSTKVDSVELTYRIFDKAEQQIAVQTEHRALEGKKTQIIAKVDSSRHPVGAYQVKVEVKTIPNARDSASYRVEKKRGFVMRWGNTPLTIIDLDLAVRQTRYIATDKEFDAMTDAKTIEERQKLFQEFWRKRDPSPDSQRNEYMEEYYSRVQYSNEHFSHYIDGWRTDMGMVFIILGSPNNVDRHPFDYDSKPYEVWSYYEYNRQVIFVDETGFGDYRLLTPIWDLLHRVK
jgi:GWxTD domain-containing protein